MYINSQEFKDSLTVELDRIKTTISDEYRAYDEDSEPGIQITLACNDNGDEYALQTGDNSYTGVAYSFPHWAVSAIYRDTDTDMLADYLIDQLLELAEESRLFN